MGHADYFFSVSFTYQDFHSDEEEETITCSSGVVLGGAAGTTGINSERAQRLSSHLQAVQQKMN